VGGSGGKKSIHAKEKNGREALMSVRNIIRVY
jgi:hypothetical protein